MHVLQALGSHMRVDLCGHQTAMSEKFLNEPQVRSVGQHVCGEGMTQHVRRDLQANGDQLAVVIEDFADAPVGQPPPISVNEQSRFVRL